MSVIDSESDSNTQLDEVLLSNTLRGPGSSTSLPAQSGDSQVGELGLPLPKNEVPLPRFANMVIFFEKLRRIRGEGSKLAREKLIIGFIRSWKERVGNDVYPAVRLWFPQEDEQLRQLAKLKEQQIGKILVEAIDLPPKSSDALSLLATRKSNLQANSTDEDSLASRTKFAVFKRFPNSEYSYMRMDEVADSLVSFANSKKVERVTIMKHLLSVMHPDEIYWVVRILLRNLALNCSDKLFLRLFHENALQVYMVNKNLKTVCHQLWSTDFSVTEADKSVHLMSYYCPMKAKFIKGAAEHMGVVVDLMRTSESREPKSQFFIEEKIDGERVQLHWRRADNAAKFYSRRGTDYTSSYSGIFDDSNLNTESLTDLASDGGIGMKDIVSDDTQECILDGEVVAWDPKTNDVCGQSKVRELATHGKGATYRHVICVFDVVYHNGDVLTSTPLIKRKERLEAIFPQEKRSCGAGRLQILPYKMGTTAKDIDLEFRRVVGQMSEGLVIKNPQSLYELDGKSNSWVKVKPEFVDGYQGENMDLIVVGCFRGSGRLVNRFSSYLCALKDESNPGRYVAFTRIGSGICLAMYDYINGLLNEHIFADSKPPGWLEMGTEKCPDFYIKPEDSLVLEVKYSEILSVNAEKTQFQRSYGWGYSLRFPRYVRMREDKDVNSALTIGEMLQMQQVRSRKSEINSLAQIKRAAQNSRMSLAKRIKIGIDEEPVSVIDDVFGGQPFYICGDVESPKYMLKPALEGLVRKYGGRVEQFYRSNAIPIGDRHIPKVAQLSSDGVSVLKPAFIFDSIENHKIFHPEPRHYYSNPVSPLHPDLAVVDKHNFSLYRQQNISEIEETFNEINTNNVNVHEDQRFEVFSFLLADSHAAEQEPLKVAVFQGMDIYVSNSVGMSFLMHQLISYGNGNIVSEIRDASHIIIPDKAIKSEVNTEASGEVVDPQWVFDRWNQYRV